MPSSFLSRSALALVAVAVAAAVAASPAPAAVPAGCAPDAWEPDGDFDFRASIAAPIAVGGTVTRALCQAPNPFPRTIAGQDYDFFRFTATGGKAYSGRVVAAGSAAAGMMYGGLYRVNADGSGTPIPDVTTAPDFNGFTTDVLPAGEYGLVAYSSANQVYPGNVLDIATITGAAGAYTVDLKEAAALPTVASLTLSSTRTKPGKNVTGTVTLSAPAPAGGIRVFSESTSRLAANPESVLIAAGQTRATFNVRVTTQKPSSDFQVTISMHTATGASKSVVLTIQR